MLSRLDCECMASKVVAKPHVDQSQRYRKKRELSFLKNSDDLCCVWRLRKELQVLRDDGLRLKPPLRPSEIEKGRFRSMDHRWKLPC